MNDNDSIEGPKEVFGNHFENLRNVTTKCEFARSDDEDSSFLSMKNPSPSQRDIDLYDSQQRLRDTARDLRREQRRTPSPSMQQLQMKQTKHQHPTHRTPVKNEEKHTRFARRSPKVGSVHGSPSNDLYFTPNRHSTGSSSNEASYVTPFTSTTKHREEMDDPFGPTTSSASKQDQTITGTPVSHYDVTSSAINTTKGVSFEVRRQQLLLSEEKLNKNFERMEKLLNESGKVERNLSKMMDEEERIAGRREDKEEEKEKRRKKKKEEEEVNYAQALACSMEIHRTYERNVVKMEEQTRQVEMFKKKMVETMTRKENMKGVEKELAKKRELINDLKKKFDQIIRMRDIIAKTQKKEPYILTQIDMERLRFWDVLFDLSNDEFLKESGKEHKILSEELRQLIVLCRNVVSKKKQRKQERRQVARNSEVLKIPPLNLADDADVSASERSERRVSQKVDATTQVTARSEVETRKNLMLTSPRTHGIEPLNLDELKKPSSVEGLNEMLDAIVLNEDQSLDTLNGSIKGGQEEEEEGGGLNRFDATWPVTRPTSAQDSPKSSRTSLDLTTARRLSEGVAHYLEVYRKSLENEKELEKKVEEEEKKEEEKPTEQVERKQQTPTPSLAERLDNPFVDDEEDETKKFVYQDEYEDDFEEEDLDEDLNENTLIEEIQSRDESLREMNESADDSSFLLNDRPAPKIASIFDETPILSRPTTPKTPSPPESPQRSTGQLTSDQLAAIKADTPRYFEKRQELPKEENEEIDWETHCCQEIMPSLTEMMIEAAIEMKEKLRGLTWLKAEKYMPMKKNLEAINQEFMDNFEILDSLSILAWGTIVEELNEKYLKYGIKDLTEQMIEEFKKDAKRRVREDVCTVSIGDDEWHRDIRIGHKTTTYMTDHVDYRIDVRNKIPEEEKEKHRWMRMTMEITTNRYTSKKLDEYWNNLEEVEIKKLEGSMLKKALDI